MEFSISWAAIKLTPEQIEKIKQQISTISDTFYNHSAYNQHVIITELIKNELNPSRNISEIISDIIKSKDKTDGSIMDTLNEKSPKYVNYDSSLKQSHCLQGQTCIYNKQKKWTSRQHTKFYDSGCF